MATVQFLGIGDPIEAFNIDGTLTNKPLLRGEKRLRKEFPYPTLETWRRIALQNTTRSIVTGTSPIGTRARATLLFAHEADLAAVFHLTAQTTKEDLAGYYVDKLKVREVDQTLPSALSLKTAAMAELRQQGVPQQFIDLILSRLESPSFNDRTPGLCAAVYLTSVLLTDLEET